MKKAKLLVTVLCAMALIGGCLTGCGSNDGSTSGKSKDKNTIAFSELFKDGDVVVYYGNFEQGKSFEGKDEHVEVYIYNTDGTYEYYTNIYHSNFGILGELTQMSDDEFAAVLDDAKENTREKSEVKSSRYTYGEYKLGMWTDSTGNNVESEGIFHKEDYKNRNYRHMFSAFVGHTTVYDTSYMMFQIIDKNANNSTIFYLIKDTDKTKDKTVVFDEIGTDGILVDVENSDKAFE